MHPSQIWPGLSTSGRHRLPASLLPIKVDFNQSHRWLKAQRGYRATGAPWVTGGGWSGKQKEEEKQAASLGKSRLSCSQLGMLTQLHVAVVGIRTEELVNSQP